MSSANLFDVAWPLAPTRLAPATDEVIVWRIALNDVAPERGIELSPDERARADRFAFPQLRQAFLQGRLFLRRVLANVLGVAPNELAFSSEGNGKPILAGRSLAFNLSHSGGAAVLATAGTGPIGVDIEAVQTDRDLLGLAKRYFAPCENGELLNLRADLRVAAFYRCWTRKEAFIKALGEGLSRPLDSFAVSTTADESPAIHIFGDDAVAEQWRVFNLEVGKQFAGAVVAPAQVQRLSCFALHKI